MLDKSKTYLIVGLGLLGGKYAQVLSQKGYHVTGITHSQSTLDYALQHDYIRAGKNADFEDLVREADCIIFGLYPTVLLDWVKQYGQLIRPGTMVTDVSGVKRGVVEPVQAALPEGVEFIASHPMAGRETSGIAHSAEVNFAPANFIITPTEKNSQAGIDWCRDLAAELGFKRISVLTPAEHDHMIGYVSQLCHAIAVSLMCASDNSELANYTGDSFRDLTRIAHINDKMWAELFLWNKDNLISEIDMFESALQDMRKSSSAMTARGWRKCSVCPQSAVKRLTRDKKCCCLKRTAAFYLARAGAEYGYMCRRFTISFFRALPRKMTRPRNVMTLMIRQMTHGRLWASSLPE